jgi:hypothetical protein
MLIVARDKLRLLGFVGIVVPHLVRLVTGPDHRFVLPASALLGATLTLVADAVARVVVAPAELPIGIVTAAISPRGSRMKLRSPALPATAIARRSRILPAPAPAIVIDGASVSKQSGVLPT